MKYVGEKFVTNENFEIKIIDYIDRNNVLIQFTDRPDYQVWSTMQNIKNGQIKNPYLKTVYNIGYYGVGEHTSRKNNKKTPQYIKWFSMFDRCYNPKVHENFPRYKDCMVSEEFHNFQNFAQWYDKKIYKCKYPLELDKDLFEENNKIYCPSKCCFLPKEINATLNSKRHDKEVMNYIYNKYKHDVPYYIRMELLKLTTYKPKKGDIL